MQTPYGPYHIKHQHKETANHSEYSFAYYSLLHMRHKHSTPTRQNQCPTNGPHFKLHATHLKQMTQTQIHPLHYPNAHLDPQSN